MPLGYSNDHVEVSKSSCVCDGRRGKPRRASEGQAQTAALIFPQAFFSVYLPGEL